MRVCTSASPMRAAAASAASGGGGLSSLSNKGQSQHDQGSPPPPPDDDWFRASFYRTNELIEKNVKCRILPAKPVHRQGRMME